MNPPILNRFYRFFLDDEDSARFVQRVTQTYTIPTLHRIAVGGDRFGRRASILTLTYIGGRESFEVIGHALKDSDRAVRVLASDGIRSVWSRSYGSDAEKQLNIVTRLLISGQLEQAIDLSNELIEQHPDFAEAWNKRSIALFEMEETYESIADCQKVLELNPFHFPAATGLGHCYMDLEEPARAIEHFQYALAINPDLEYVRNQIDHLQRSLDF